MPTDHYLPTLCVDSLKPICWSNLNHNSKSGVISSRFKCARMWNAFHVLDFSGNMIDNILIANTHSARHFQKDHYKNGGLAVHPE